ncbi:MAG: VanZ family protein [Chthoniobacterales bacterium]
MKTERHQFLRYGLPVILWLSLIFAASTDMMSAEHTSRIIAPFLHWLVSDIAPATIALVQLLVRKGAHVTEYAVLGALMARAFRYGLKKTGTHFVFLVWLLCAVWAALDEFHQTFVASRTGSPIDVMIDAAGALLGVGVYWLSSRAKAPAKSDAA